MLQEREWLKILKNSKAAGKNAVKDNKQWGDRQGSRKGDKEEGS